MHAPIKDTTYRTTAVSLVCGKETDSYTIFRSEKNGIQNYVLNIPSRRSYEPLYSNEIADDLIGQTMDGIRPDVLHTHCIQDMGTDVL